MTAHQATDALTEAVLTADWGITRIPARRAARKDRGLVRLAIRETISLLPPAGVDQFTAEAISPLVSARLWRKKLAGVIVVGFFFTVFWEVIIGVIVSLIVRWLMSDSKEAGLIRQAKG